MPKLIPIVRVKWDDSCGLGRWATLEAHRMSGVGECESVGFMVRSDRHSMNIVQSLDHKCDSADNGLTIPRSVIKSVETIGKAKFPNPENKGGKK